MDVHLTDVHCICQQWFSSFFHRWTGKRKSLN